MLRERVRPQWTPEQLRDIYSSPFDHRALGDGSLPRVEVSSWIGRSLPMAAGVGWARPSFVADLSCGNGAIARSIASHWGRRPLLGDYAPGFEVTGPIEETIVNVEGIDIFVCCETLEHLWEPLDVLRQIRRRSSLLVCSVPLWERAEQEQNGEHYWAFDREGFESMLADAGWTPSLFAEVPGYPVGGDGGFYQTGIWGCW